MNAMNAMDYGNGGPAIPIRAECFNASVLTRVWFCIYTKKP